MEKAITTMQYILTGIGCFLGWFIGGVDGFMTALICFVAVDYITGVMCAFLEKKLSSKVGFRGIFKKFMIFFLVGISNILDVYVIKSGSAVRMAVILFYIYNEGISILENCTILGLPVPEKLKEALVQVSNRDRKEDD